MGISEFRQNLVSGEWVLIASSRADRPHAFKEREKFVQTLQECPFEGIGPSGNAHEVVWRGPDNDDWRIAVIKNKYPAVQPGECGPDSAFGPFLVHPGKGVHNLFIYRDHDKQLHDFNKEEIVEVIRAYKRRIKEIYDLDGCTKYVMLFHNFGREAGASVYHSHSQILSTPIVPPSVSRSLNGAYRFFQERKQRVSDVIFLFEKEGKRRVIWENDLFLAFCPFASKYPGEIRIYPKNGEAHFEYMPDEFDHYFAEVLGNVLKKMKKAYNDPAYNFFIHTAPREGVLQDIHEFYSWHVEIFPKLKTDAGFEMGTGIDINMMDPDDAAARLQAAEI